MCAYNMKKRFISLNDSQDTYVSRNRKKRRRGDRTHIVVIIANALNDMREEGS